jgi:cytochrome c5
MSKSKSSGILETVGVVAGSFIGAILIITIATAKYDSVEVDAVVVENESQKNIQPVAKVKVAENTTPNASNSISGEKIVQESCAMCHAGGLMSSPKIGDVAQWAPRISQGKEILVKNAINGIRMMPPKGGNARLTDEEVTAAVVYMVNASGGTL